MNLLERLKSMLAVPDSPDAKDLLPLAVTTLLIEVADSDHVIADEELELIQRGVAARFAISDAAAAAMVQEARDEHDQNVGMFAYTQAINAAFEPAEKRQLITELWDLAYHDDRLHRYEEHVIRRIAELLYVPHSDFIAAKQDARQRAR